MPFKDLPEGQTHYFGDGHLHLLPKIKNMTGEKYGCIDKSKLQTSHICGCGKETLSKLTPENIKKAAKMANQDQRDLIYKALPNWEKILGKDFTTYNGADEFLYITGFYESIIKFIRETIKTERKQAIKEVIKILENERDEIYFENHIGGNNRVGFNEAIKKVKDILAKYKKYD